MRGLIADFIRLAWALPYWNLRKTWFRLRRGRARCPCQNPSDSGRALETACDASHAWPNPRRFRHVCPLLVETPAGLRCSVNTADVRPFWGRAAAYYGLSLSALYLAGVVLVFGFLRTIGYPVNLFHTLWPPSWHHLREARGSFFLNKAYRAYAEGRPSEGQLYLANAHEFDPRNYTAAFLLARNTQLTQPGFSNALFARLLADYPEQRDATAQEWFRQLLPRGDFRTIERLASEQITRDVPHASVWMRGLIFATRLTKSDAPLRALLASDLPAARIWHPLLGAELLLRAARPGEIPAVFNTPWAGMPAYSIFYQVESLIRLGEGLRALDLLAQYGRRLDDEARVTLMLDAYARLGATRLLQAQVDALLTPPLNLPTAKIVAAHLVRHPDPAILAQLHAKFLAAAFPINNDTAGIYLSLYCAAGTARDWPRAGEIASLLRRNTGGRFAMLSTLESFFRGDTTITRIATILPTVPLPLEVNYALLERYPGAMHRTLNVKKP